jgi:hypothetical protein
MYITKENLIGITFIDNKNRTWVCSEDECVGTAMWTSEDSPEIVIYSTPGWEEENIVPIEVYLANSDCAVEDLFNNLEIGEDEEIDVQTDRVVNYIKSIVNGWL